jgi:hypothetical protein
MCLFSKRWINSNVGMELEISIAGIVISYQLSDIWCGQTAIQTRHLKQLMSVSYESEFWQIYHFDLLAKAELLYRSVAHWSSRFCNAGSGSVPSPHRKRDSFSCLPEVITNSLFLCEYMETDTKSKKRAVTQRLVSNVWKLISKMRPPLWSSGKSSWLQIRRPGFDSQH